MAERAVWKYPIEHGPVAMPARAKVVLVGHDADRRVCVWAEVDPTASTTSRFFLIVGTGERLPEYAEYVGSYFSLPFVWHVYEVPA